MRYYFLTLIGFILTFQNFAQEWNFRNFSVADGLTQSQVISIAQTQHGYIVFGTLGGGFSLFDGQNFISFGSAKGISNEVVNEVLVDESGMLWVATEAGVCTYDGFSLEEPEKFSNWKNIPVLTIYENAPGDIWFGTEGHGVLRYINGQVQQFPVGPSSKNRLINCIARGPQSSILFGTDIGLYAYYPENNQIKQIGLEEENLSINALLLADDETLWIASYSGLFQKKGTSWTDVSKVRGIDFSSCLEIKQWADRSIWIGTDSGFFVFKDDKFKKYTHKNGLIHNRVFSIFEDYEGNIWLGTDNGVSEIVKSIPIINYLSNTGSQNQSVWKFHETQDGQMWVFTEEETFSIDLATGVVQKISLPIFSGQISVFFELTPPKWMICREKTVYFQTQDQVLETYSNWDFEFDEFLSSYKDRKGRIWLGTDRGSVIVYDGGKFMSYASEHGIPRTLINGFCEDSLGNMWVATDKGLHEFNGEKFISPKETQALQGKSVMNLVLDSEHKLWVGTYGFGVFRLNIDDPEKPLIIDHLFHNNQAFDEEILSMIFDAGGDLWIGTNSGLLRLEMQPYLKEGRVVVKHFGFSEGVRGVECNQNAVYMDSSQKLWFGTIDGAVRVDPFNFSTVFPPSRTHIQKVELFFNTVDIWDYAQTDKARNGLPSGLSLPAEMNHMSFSFIGISTTVPGMVEYSWKLEGFDHEWSPRSAFKRVTYSNLPPGDYKFLVRSSTDPDKWQDNTASYSFQIRSPFWRESWFYALVFLIFLLVLYALYFLKTRTIRRQNLELERVIQDRTRELELEKQKVEVANKELGERVEQRTRQLEEKNSQLIQAQKMEAIGSLAGGVAHDLNNILSGIVSYPDLLLLKMDENDPKSKYLKIIKQSGERAASMVQDLLTLTRKGHVRKEKILLDGLLFEFLESPAFKHKIQEHPNVELKTDFHTEGLFLEGSKSHIYKTLLNLAFNGIEAMEQGGTLLISSSSCILNQPVKGYFEVEKGPYLKLSVHDTGEGISHGDILKIFEPFYSKKKLGKSGTGLGMTVVWWTVKDHQGYIEVNSEKGVGTRFDLYFPACDQHEEIQPSSEFQGELVYRGNGEHILIIDDETQQCELAEIILKDLNYRVSCVSSGEEAVLFIQKEPVDLILLDMIMDPGIDGYETYLQMLQFQPGLKAVVASGFSDSDRVEKTLRLGAGAYLKKPYLRIQLAQIVRQELDRRNESHSKTPE